MFYFANEAYSGILIRDGDGAYLGISLTYSFNTRASQVTLREMGNATYQTKLIYKTYREGIMLHCTTLWYERLLLRLVNTILRFLAATKQLYGWFSPSVFHIWWRNDAQSLMLLRRGALLFFSFSRSSIKFQGHTAKKPIDFEPNWAFPDCNSSLNSPMSLKWCTSYQTTMIYIIFFRFANLCIIRTYS